MRTRKGERYYYWLGNTLKMERWGLNTIYYYYDESGISGLRYDNKEYYYHKNIFGDVVAIYDKNKELQATYEYDAWGNHTVTNATDDNIGNVNPIRYRSYYWDREFNLYYLQSRYYFPEIGRFISPDSVDYLEPQTIGGLNLYAYCLNNPVMYCDHSGHFLDAIFDALFIVWGISDLINGGYKDWKNWVALGIDVVFAVLPFVPAGIGQTIKAGDNALNLLSTVNRFDNLYDLSKVTIVGETMSRVGWIANGYNATNNIYGGFQAYNRMANMGKVGKIGAEVFGKIHNANWLMKKLRTGYNVIDIGLDMFKAKRSSSYMMERIILNIWETRNIWKFSLNYWL